MRLSAPATHRAAWLALVCHALVACGLPLPVGAISAAGRRSVAARPGKDRTRPFPCMDKPCGCATAAQCFANCCCHTPAERLAWAKAHRVEPAILAALESRLAASAVTAAGCRATGRGETTCHAEAAESSVDLAGPQVCSAYRALAAEPPAAGVGAAPAMPDGPASPDAPAVRTVILRDMLACGGIVTAWLACGAALPPPRVEPPAHDAPCGVVSIRDTVAASVVADLSAPPPRAA
ncbi:MAG: hypothetical protein ACKOSQ_01015 [Planctomycetaceae bacterium]